MNLLEKAKKIIEYADKGYYDKISDLQIAQYAPAICRALLNAMDELESEKIPKLNDVSDRMFAFGVRFALVVILRHLEVEE